MKYYFNLYSQQETRVDKEEIMHNIEVLTKIDQEDFKKLDIEITEGEVSVTLKILGTIWLLDQEDLAGLFIRFSGDILRGL